MSEGNRPPKGDDARAAAERPNGRRAPTASHAGRARGLRASQAGGDGARAAGERPNGRRAQTDRGIRRTSRLREAKAAEPPPGV